MFYSFFHSIFQCSVCHITKFGFFFEFSSFPVRWFSLFISIFFLSPVGLTFTKMNPAFDFCAVLERKWFKASCRRHRHQPSPSHVHVRHLRNCKCFFFRVWLSPARSHLITPPTSNFVPCVFYKWNFQCLLLAKYVQSTFM